MAEKETTEVPVTIEKPPVEKASTGNITVPASKVEETGKTEGKTIPANLFEPGKGKKPKVTSIPNIEKALGDLDLTTVEEKKKLRERSGLYALIFTINTILVVGAGWYSISNPIVKVVEKEKVVEKVVEKEKIVEKNNDVYRLNDNTTITIAVGGERSTMTLGELKGKMSTATDEQKEGEVTLISVEGKTIQSKLNIVPLSDLLRGEIRIQSTN